MSTRASLTLLVLVQLVVATFAEVRPAQQKPDRRGGASVWRDANKITLKLLNKAERSTAEWELETGDDDLVLHLNQQMPGGKETGVIMVIAGCRMLVKGLKLKPGSEIDALDGSVLTIKLALELLARAIPGGPGSVGASTSFNLTEDHDGLTISTRSASGDFQPPWSVRGVASSASPTTVDFDFSFTFSPEDSTPKQTLAFTGRWEITQTKLALADDLPLKDWQIYSLGMSKKTNDDGSVIFDYGTDPVKRVGTLGELRKTIGDKQPAPQTSTSGTARKTPKLSTDQ